MTKEGISLEQIAAQNEQLKTLLSTIEGNMTEGRKARQAADNAAASIRIVEKKNIVLKNENSRLYRKIDDLNNLVVEQAARIEELEEGQTAPKTPEAYQALLNERDKYQARCVDYERTINKLEADIKEGCRIIEAQAARIKELEGGDFPHYAYEKALEDTRKENGRLLYELSKVQAAFSRFKAEARQQPHFDYEKVINALTMERDTFKAKYEATAEENAIIKNWLAKLGFQYISVWPQPAGPEE